jgi:putative flippase GtrA
MIKAISFLLFLYKKNKNLVLYGIIGLISASLDFSLFRALITYFNVDSLVANIYSVIFGISCSFFLNRNFNFKIKDKMPNRIFSFFLVGLLGLVFGTLMLSILIKYCLIDILILKFLSTISVAFLQFNLNKYITFKN